MEKISVILVGGVDINPEEEESFNEWYNNVHIPMVLKCPEVVRATRYLRVEADEAHPKYLAIYELKSEKGIERLANSKELKAAQQDRKERFGDEKGFKMKWRAHYKPIFTRESPF